MNKHKALLLIGLVFTLSQTACVSNKKLAYLNQVKDSTFTALFKMPTINKGDILYIGISGADPLSAAVFNNVNVATSGNMGVNIIPNVMTPGILVPENGNIELPKIGAIQVIGKTTQALSLEIQKAVKDYVKNPLVTVRYMNYRLSVLGEVNKPGVFTINNERVTILEALAMAGDLTVYGKRTNILLIRDQNGVQELKRIDLTTKAFLEAPYFYLKSNDVLYVEPNNAKAYAGTKTPVLLPVAISVISLILLIFNQFK